MTINPKVIDLSHWDNAEIDFAKAFAAGYRGIIHKATEGNSFVDNKFRAREIAARAAGMLWGWYHFMSPGDVAQQAEHFFTTIGGKMRGPGILVLDHENPGAKVNDALRWLEVMEHLSGQIPWLYTGRFIRDSMDNRHKPAFARYPLWLPEYDVSVANVPLPWTKATLWQFSESYSIPGVGVVDASSFEGTDDELRQAWGVVRDSEPAPATAEEGSEHDVGILESSDSVRVDNDPVGAGQSLPPDV